MVRRAPTEYALLARRLRQARKAAGLTQIEAAKTLGRTQGFISNCESGQRRVDVIELKAFARAYGVKLTFFL